MRGIARDWVTAGFYRFGLGWCYRWGPVRGLTYSSRGRSVGLNVQSCHRKLVSAYERCSNVYGGTEKVLAGAFGGRPQLEVLSCWVLGAAGGWWSVGVPPTTGNRRCPGPCGTPSPGAVALPLCVGISGPRGCSALVLRCCTVGEVGVTSAAGLLGGCDVCGRSPSRILAGEGPSLY